MLQTTILKYFKYVLLVVFFGLFIYVLLRANALSFTHDESLTYTIIKGDPSTSFANTPNNHLLNTWLIYLCSSVFGMKELFLRLPNVLAFALYVYFSYKILAKQTSVALILLGASLLISNSYLLDFFSLSRGYGLAIGFSLAAVYYLLERDSNTYKQYITNLCLSLFFSLLAAYSNLMYTNLNIAIIAMFGLELLLGIQAKKIIVTKQDIKYLVSILAIDFLALSILVRELFILKSNDQLYYGGSNGFITDTVSSLLWMSYLQPPTIHSFILTLVILLFSLSIIYLIINKREKLTAFSKSLILLILMIAAPLAQHFFLDSLYPVNRTGLVFILLFSLLTYYLFSSVYNKNKSYRTVITILILFIIIPLNYAFIKTLNFHATREWGYDAETKEVMILIDQENKNKDLKEESISISNSWFYEPSMNYYRDLYKMNYLTIPNRDRVNIKSEYIFTTPDDLKVIDSSGSYKKTYEHNTAILFKKK